MDRWLAYIEAHPQAVVLLFRDTTGDSEIHAVYRQMQTDARAVIAASIVRRQPAIDPDLVQPVAEFLRAGNVGLALWWIEHPEVPRATMLQIVLAAPAPAPSIEPTSTAET